MSELTSENKFLTKENERLQRALDDHRESRSYAMSMSPRRGRDGGPSQVEEDEDEAENLDSSVDDKVADKESSHRQRFS